MYMSHKKEGLIGEIMKVVLVVYGIIDALNGFQTSLHVVDWLVSLGTSIKSPIGDYLLVLAIVLLFRAFEVLDKRLTI